MLADLAASAHADIIARTYAMFGRKWAVADGGGGTAQCAAVLHKFSVANMAASVIVHPALIESGAHIAMATLAPFCDEATVLDLPVYIAFTVMNLASNPSNFAALSGSGMVPLAVKLVSLARADVHAPAAAALRGLASDADIAALIVAAGGTQPLVELLSSPDVAIARDCAGV